jgi:hypothetical protein
LVVAARITSSGCGVLALVVCGALGCSAYPTLKNVPVDCSVTNAYDFLVVDTFEGETTPNLFGSADTTPGATMKPSVGTPPDGARCGSTSVLELKASGNDDWGSLSGYNGFGPRDASAYEGFSFWARVYGASNSGLTILFGDPNTYNANPMSPSPPGSYCTNYPTPDGGAASGTIVDPATGMVLSSGSTTAPPPPNACGDYYATTMHVTSDWHFYTIPFSAFQQSAMPNRVPNADLAVTGTAPGTKMITSALMTLTFRFPKGVDTDLWMDDLAFYRAKGSADGGLDAPQM